MKLEPSTLPMWKQILLVRGVVWRVGTLRKCGAKAWWISEELDHFAGGGNDQQDSFGDGSSKTISSIPAILQRGARGCSVVVASGKPRPRILI